MAVAHPYGGAGKALVVAEIAPILCTPRKLVVSTILLSTRRKGRTVKRIFICALVAGGLLSAQAMLPSAAAEPEERLVVRHGALTAESGQPPMRLGVTMGHSDVITAIAFSRDGRLVATAAADMTVRIWEFGNHRELRSMRSADAITELSFSYDGNLVLGRNLHEIDIWRTRTGQRIWSGNALDVSASLSPFTSTALVRSIPGRITMMNLDGEVTQSSYDKPCVMEADWQLAFSPDGKLVAGVCGDHVVQVWDARSGLPRLQLHDRSGPLIFSRDGRALISTMGETRSVVTTDLKTGRARHVLGSTAQVELMALSPDGKRLAIRSKDLTIKLLEVESGRDLRSFSASEPTRFEIRRDRSVNVRSIRDFESDPLVGDQLAFSSDGRKLMSINSDGTAQRWDLRSGLEAKKKSTGEPDPNASYLGQHRATAFSPDGAFLVTGGNDGKAEIWNMDIVQQGAVLWGATVPFHSISMAKDFHSMAVNFGRTVFLWDPVRGKMLDARKPDQGSEFTAIALSPEGRFLALGTSEGDIEIRDTTTDTEVDRFPGPKSEVWWLSFSDDGKTLVSLNVGGPIRLREFQQQRDISSIELPYGCKLFSSVRLSHDGQHLLAGCWDGHVLTHDVQTGTQATYEGHYFWGQALNAHVTATEFTGNADMDFASASLDGTVRVWAGKTGKEIRRLGDLWDPGVTALAFSEDGERLAAGRLDGSIALWERSTDRLTQLPGHASPVTALAFARSDRVISSGLDGTIRLWDSKNGKELLTLAALDDGSLAMLAPDGRFDATKLEEVKGLQWIAADDPLRALPIEIFMRDYFEPHLLSRVLSGDKFTETRPLDKLNRAQPRVKVVSVKPETAAQDRGGLAPETVRVTVDVEAVSRESGPPGSRRRMATGVYDLRLFRDGQLVEQRPAEPAAATTYRDDRRQELARWRQQRRVLKYDASADLRKRVVFKGIRLPRLAGKDKVVFSAYAFNVDRVKSETSTWTYDLPQGPKPRVPRAYIVTIGVNAFEDETWDLQYAANDARQSGSELKKRFEALLAPDGSRRYDKVVWVPLISDATREAGQPRTITAAQASKKQIEAVLKTLAGQAADSRALAGIESANELRRADPEDLVVIVVSTHGMVDDRGTFRFLPSDIGRKFSPSRAVDPAAKASVLAHAVSNDELAQWLRGLDAVDQVMIIDACHSAASVQGDEFKPGPMGSRGLGQLAYDKGMRILAATQVEQDAIDGTDKTRMGLLIYALIEDGLRAGKADSAPRDGRIMLSEWLNYASERVPGLFQGLQEGSIKGSKGTVVYSSDPEMDAARRTALQQPSLFDFARGRDLPLAVEGR